MFRLILIIGIGRFIGGVSRFLFPGFIQDYAATAFPYGTFVVNFTGCFLTGLFYGFSERGNLPDADLRMFLTVGYFGGFTTFSTFFNERKLFCRILINPLRWYDNDGKGNCYSS